MRVVLYDTVCVWIYVRFRCYPRAWHQGRLAVWHLPVSPARKRGIVRRLASLWSALSGGRSLRRLPSPWSLEMLRTWNVFPSETIGVHGHQKKGAGWWMLKLMTTVPLTKPRHAETSWEVNNFQKIVAAWSPNYGPWRSSLAIQRSWRGAAPECNASWVFSNLLVEYAAVKRVLYQTASD